MSAQGDRQAAVRAITGTALSYEGDWHALFDLQSVPPGDFNGRMLAWINLQLGTSYSEVNGAMWAFAQASGGSSWGGLGTFRALPNPPAGFALLIDADGAYLVDNDGAFLIGAV